MEETVGTSRDSLVAINTPRADYSYWRLAVFHYTTLHGTCVSSKQYVWTFHKECVLHVARRVVGGKIHRGKHVPVVLYFRTLSQHKSHSSENVYDLVLYKRQRVACAEFYGRCCSSKVYIR